MRVSTKVVIDIESNAVVERESGEYSGPIEDCRGSDQQSNAVAMNAASSASTGAANASALATQQGQQANQIQSMILPQYQSMLSNPASATPEGQEAAATFGSAQTALANRAAKTGNSAGTVSAEDQLAQQKAQTLSNITSQNRNTALTGLQNMYGTDANLYAKTLGLPAEYLNTQISAANSGTNAMAPKGPQPGFGLGPGGLSFSL